MELTLTTPALLFPAISLLLLAYTNRFLAVASVIRQLHSQVMGGKRNYQDEITNLRYRIVLIRRMQLIGVLSLFFCVLSMFLLFAGWALGGQLAFGTALVMLLISLAISVREIQRSVSALDLHLRGLEEE